MGVYRIDDLRGFMIKPTAQSRLPAVFSLNVSGRIESPRALCDLSGFRYRVVVSVARFALASFEASRRPLLFLKICSCHGFVCECGEVVNIPPFLNELPLAV